MLVVVYAPYHMNMPAPTKDTSITTPPETIHVLPRTIFSSSSWVLARRNITIPRPNTPAPTRKIIPIILMPIESMARNFIMLLLQALNSQTFATVSLQHPTQALAHSQGFLGYYHQNTIPYDHLFEHMWCCHQPQSL